MCAYVPDHISNVKDQLLEKSEKRWRKIPNPLPSVFQIFNFQILLFDPTTTNAKWLILKIVEQR